MGVTPEVARLYERHAARARALGERAAPDDLFIHFGHWPDPDRADTSEDGFRCAQRALDDAMLALAQVRDGHRVLDAGCGVGGTLATLDERLSRVELHGLNIDPAQIDAARACVRPRAGNRVAFHVGDARALPFEAASFDVVLAIECIAHFLPRGRFLAEAARVLAGGGRLVLSDFTAAPELRAARDAGGLPPGFAEAIEHGLGPWDDLFGDLGDVAALARTAGLSLVERTSATRETAPTYRCILRGSPEELLASESVGIEERGMAALAWAHERGLMRMEYFAFERPARVAAALPA